MSKRIEVSDKIYDQLTAQAQAQGITISELIQRLVEQNGESPATTPEQRAAIEEFLSASGFVNSGDPQSSLCVDEVIYGVRR
jgi:negative regulator of replication initiation